MKRFPLFLLLVVALYSCSSTKWIGKTAQKNVIKSKALTNAHIGISVYEPASGKWWYNYQGDKYFVPASNTKLATCYAAMKYLGDSLVGLRYQKWSEDYTAVAATGDPTLLHPDFKNQPVFEFLKKQQKIYIDNTNWKDERWGSGWTWNDYNEGYMAERSPMPIYGNVVRFTKAYNLRNVSSGSISVVSALAFPTYFQNNIHQYVDYNEWVDSFSFERDIASNIFRMLPSRQRFIGAEVPFVTNDFTTTCSLLHDTLGREVRTLLMSLQKPTIIHSQPTDTFLRITMHRSDNFFAEQSLLMVSNERLGYMNDAKIIDTILKTDFKDLPQKPRWVDGSGLSRYNLFTPQDFVTILNKMRTEFGMDRIKNILATGNTGTLTNYYKADSTYIFAKTGTLSGVVALSGFLYTKQNKLLLFSVLVNNHTASATEVRRTVEKFIEGIRNKY